MEEDNTQNMGKNPTKKSRQDADTHPENAQPSPESLSVARFVRVVHTAQSAREIIEAATQFFYANCGCDAVGIRLSEGDDFPYLTTCGFSPDFVAAERSLCCRNPAGCHEKSALQCLCGAMVRGDMSRNRLTSRGALCVNDFAGLLGSLTHAECEKLQIRGRCAQEGFQSMALFPLYAKERRVGLLQLNSRTKSHFTPEKLGVCEELAGYLSEALERLETEEALHRVQAARAAQLQAAQASIRQLQEELLQISEREQQHIAQELHDGICQHLTGTAFASQVLLNRMVQRNDSSAGEMERICGLLAIAINETRHLSHGLYPVRAEEGGLRSALARLANTVSVLFGVQCGFRGSKAANIQEENMATHFYRIAQESVNNAIKHGAAAKIEIRLRKESGRVIMEIHDDGRGMPDPLPISHGIGLRIMNHRVSEFGGELKFGSGRSGGTVVRCCAPLPDKDARPLPERRFRGGEGERGTLSCRGKCD